MAYTEARNRASQKYQRENMEQVALRIAKGEKEQLEEARKAAGYSSTRHFIIDAINEKAGAEIIKPPHKPL